MFRRLTRLRPFPWRLRSPIQRVPTPPKPRLTQGALLSRVAEGEEIDLATLLRAPVREHDEQDEGRALANQLVEQLEAGVQQALTAQAHLLADLPWRERQQARRRLGEELVESLTIDLDLGIAGGALDLARPLCQDLVQLIFQGRPTGAAEDLLAQTLAAYLRYPTALSHLRDTGAGRGRATGRDRATRRLPGA